MSRGHVIAFGVVADADGTFGVGLLDFDSESDARAFADDDPTLRSGLGFAIQIRPMPFGVVARDDDGVK